MGRYDALGVQRHHVRGSVSVPQSRRQQKGEAGQDVQVRSWQAKASGSELRAREMGWLRRREFLRDMEVGMAAFGQGSGGWGVDVGGVREVGYTLLGNSLGRRDGNTTACPTSFKKVAEG